MAQNKFKVTRKIDKIESFNGRDANLIRTVEWTAVIFDSTLDDARKAAYDDFRSQFPSKGYRALAIETHVRPLKARDFVVDGKVTDELLER